MPEIQRSNLSKRFTIVRKGDDNLVIGPGPDSEAGWLVAVHRLPQQGSAQCFASKLI
jgi:hypothetical protein